MVEKFLCFTPSQVKIVVNIGVTLANVQPQAKKKLSLKNFLYFQEKLNPKHLLYFGMKPDLTYCLNLSRPWKNNFLHLPYKKLS